MQKEKSVLWLLKPYILKYKNLWIAGFISVAFTDIFMLAGPWLLKRAIDSLQKNITAEGLAIYAGLLLGVTVVSSLFRYFMRQTLIVASRKIEYDFRNNFFAHLLTLDRSYYDKMPTGDIMSRATSDMDAVRNMLGPGVMNLCSTAVTLTLALILMIGGVIGAQFGARTGQKMRGERLRLLLGLLVFAVGLRFAYALVVQPDDLFSLRYVRGG